MRLKKKKVQKYVDVSTISPSKTLTWSQNVSQTEPIVEKAGPF